MKTIGVFQVHPFMVTGGDRPTQREQRIIFEVGSLHSDNASVELRPRPDKILPDGNFPDALRTISFPHIEILDVNYIGIRGAVLVTGNGGKSSNLHFVSLDIFHCNDDVPLESFC